jgi:N-acetylmuramate 1-kinase
MTVDAKLRLDRGPRLGFCDRRRTVHGDVEPVAFGAQSLERSASLRRFRNCGGQRATEGAQHLAHIVVEQPAASSLHWAAIITPASRAVNAAHSAHDQACRERSPVLGWRATLEPRDPLDTAAQRAWLAARGFPVLHCEPLAGDVSLRRYFRVRLAEGTAILVAYPQSVRASCGRFAATTSLLTEVGVRVPAILAEDCALGFMLCEDLGARTLYEVGGALSALLPHFESAVTILARLHTLPAAAVDALNPRLDEALLDRELRQTWDCFLLPRGWGGAGAARLRWEAALGELCRQLGSRPPVPCHRDFMARNLVPLAAGEIGVLDHQDLRLGPPQYDLASLLNDSLFPPPAMTERLLELALGEARDSASRFDYHRAAAQRTLKAVGTFAAFAQRGSSRHLPLVTPTLRRAVEHLALLPETVEFAATLAADASRE